MLFVRPDYGFVAKVDWPAINESSTLQNQIAGGRQVGDDRRSCDAFYHQARGDGNGPGNQPLHRRITRGSTLAEAEPPAWSDVPLHAAHGEGP